MGDFEVTGTADFKILGAKLKVADKSMRLKLGRNIRAATAPLKSAIPEAAQRLPKSGGLADLVAKTPIRTSITNNSMGLHVKVRSAGSPPVRDVRAIDEGKLRHPVFGSNARRVAGHLKDSIKADKWVSQSVPSGYFSDPVDAATPEITAAVTKAIDEIAKELT